MRSYRQFCALARGLDVVGERWTLLLLRDLLLGPRRFGELLESLPGIGPNLLSARLTRLQAEGVIVRFDGAYGLTDRGRELEQPLLALARWSMEEMQPPNGDDRLHPGWYGFAMWAASRSDRPAAEDECYELRVDGTTFYLEATDGHIRAHHGAASDPCVILTTTTPRLLEIITRTEPPRATELTGDCAAFDRLLDACALPAVQSWDR